MHCTRLGWCLKALTSAVIGLSYFVSFCHLIASACWHPIVHISVISFLCFCPVGYFVCRIKKTLHVVKRHVTHMLFLDNQSNENISTSLFLSLMECSRWSLCHPSSGASEGHSLPWRIFRRLILWILNCSDQQSASVRLSSSQHTTNPVCTWNINVTGLSPTMCSKQSMCQRDANLATHWSSVHNVKTVFLLDKNPSSSSEDFVILREGLLNL